MRFDSDFGMTIGGSHVVTSLKQDVINPATECIIAAAPLATEKHVDAAVASARNALPSWQATPIGERQVLLRHVADNLDAFHEEFAHLLTREQGKPLAEARREVDRCVQWLRSTAAMTLPVETIASGEGRHVECRRVAIGVVGAIAPWNFPLSLAVWKIAPALLAGNTMVLKPSPFTPLTALKLGEMCRNILPPGVLNVVSGDDQVGPWLTSHSDIDKLAFTGSTPTGKAIMSGAAATLKRITLELGGNDPAIVLPDIDIEANVPLIFWAAFRNNAQICIAAKRIFVHESIYDDFLAQFSAYARGVRTGDGADPETEIGPVQNREQYRRLTQTLAEANKEGVTFSTGGTAPADTGLFLPISIADNPPDTSCLVSEEVFGPILPILRYATLAEAIERANATPYGLGASVWSADLEQAAAVGNQLKAGTVWINTAGETSPEAPFAGHGQSGFGVENGLVGLHEYTVPQTCVMNTVPVGSVH